MSRPKKRAVKKRGPSQPKTPRRESEPVDTMVRFRFGEVFPPDDVLSEWMATLALAFNDIAYVNKQIPATYEKPAHEYFYLLRMALSHFHEAAKFLDDTKAIPEVKTYVDSLEEEARQLYADCLERYNRRKGTLGPIRNLSAFHYPKLTIVAGSRKKRAMQKVLEGLAEEHGSFFKAASGTIGDSRGLFADDIASRIFTYGDKGDASLYASHTEIEEAISSFMRFVNRALDEWWYRAGKRGVRFTTRPGRPVSYSELSPDAQAE